MSTPWGQGKRDLTNTISIFPVLLIECVNNPQPLSFITKENENEKHEKRACIRASAPDKLTTCREVRNT